MKNFIFIHFCLFILFSSLQAHKFEKFWIEAKKDDLSNVPISKFFLFGERCSGTHYVRSLISSNLDLKIHPEFTVVFNHYLPWVGYENFYHGEKINYSFEGTEDTLFIYVFRDPYDWLRSFHRFPVHAPKSHFRCSFKKFIRAPYAGMYDSKYEYYKKYYTETNPLVDINPETKKPFKNILKLRNAKNKNILIIKERNKNYCLVNYEIARDFPEELINSISNYFNINKNPNFSSVTFKRGIEAHGTFVQKKYVQIDSKDLKHINNELDWDTESKLGYRLKYVVK